MTSRPPPYPIVVAGASSTVTSTSRRAGRPVLELADIDSAEQPERAQPAPALEQIAKPERRARPQQDLAADDFLGVSSVADDDDVVDEGLRTLDDGDREVDAACGPPTAPAQASPAAAENPRLRYSSWTASRAAVMDGS